MRRFNIRFFPTLMLFRPNDSRFPLKFDGNRNFEDVRQFLDSFEQQGKPIEKKITPQKLEKMCKPHADKAVEIFERDVRTSGLLLSPEDMKYYSSMVAGIKHLAKHNKQARKLVDKMKNLEASAKIADRQDLKEFDEFRKDVVKETKDEYISIAENIANKIADVESILDARGLRRRANAGHRRQQHHSERSKTKAATQNEGEKSTVQVQAGAGGA
jgi:hypothetical protein